MHTPAPNIISISLPLPPSAGAVRGRMRCALAPWFVLPNVQFLSNCTHLLLYFFIFLAPWIWLPNVQFYSIAHICLVFDRLIHIIRIYLFIYLFIVLNVQFLSNCTHSFSFLSYFFRMSSFYPIAHIF
jgi:hypothetical protein